MKFLSKFARDLGVGRDVYVVGGAVRSFAMGLPIKDLDIVVDSVNLGHGRDSEWFAKKLADAIPARTHLVTNQYGVAILSIRGEFLLDGIDLDGEVIEIANARKESYSGAGGKGKGYKPTDVVPATIMDDVTRRDFGFNTLLWRLHDLVQGPEYAEIVDLTGVGKAQLESRLLSTPLDPDKTFSDDPTRMLRVIKFLLRFPLEIVPEVESSIRRNAHRLRDMPWEAVGNILVGDILKSAKATTGIRVMKSLGILDVLVEMIQETPPFAAFLTKQLANGNHSVELLLELADLGIAGRVLSFLTTEQRARFKELSQGMDGDESRRFLEVLRVPPVDNAALIQEFTLEGRDRGLLVPIAREAILLDPSLATHEVRLNDRVRESLRATRGQGKTADLNPPLGVAGGPCKVVDRILQNVRNPRLRENLTEGAETGALSNSEARKVYPIATTESGSGFKSFSITPHAQYRMDFRSITVKDVEAALNSFIKWLMGVKDTNPSWYEDTLNQTEIAWIDPKTRLKVVFGLDGGNVQIITVFWKGEQDPAPTHCEVSAMARQASPLQPVTDKTLQDEVKGLEALASEIQAVVDTFLETVPMPHVGRIAAIQLRSQTECFTKCEHAARHAQRVVNKAFTILQTQPGNATATAVVRDAGMLLEKFDTYRVKSREMLSAMAQKIMPMALKTIVTYTLDGVRAELYEPNRVSVTVFPHYVPTKVGDSMVDGMVFDAYLTVFPNPVDVAAGLPKYQQFVLTQSTIGDTNVYLMAIDRTNVLDPTKPAEVGAPGAVSKILGYLKGWDNLLSVHTTKMAAARTVLTRPEVVKFLVTELKKIPGAKVKSSKNSIILVPGAMNPAVVGIEILNLNLDKAPFRMTLKNGMVGWGWDAYRKPAPVFHGPHNTLNLNTLENYSNPEQALRDLVKNDILPQIGKAGMVWNGTALVPMPMGKAPAPAKTPAAPAAPPPPAPKVDYLAAITSALKGMRLGPVGGRILSVDYYPGASPSWSVEPANRERLDHYVGSGYRDRDGDDDDDDGDSDGWDSEAWEQDYADPVSTAAYKWLAAEFGPSLFYVEVGEKGHIDIQLTAEGRKKFLP